MAGLILLCAILVCHGVVDAASVRIDVVIYTGDVLYAGTDASVYVNLRGRNGATTGDEIVDNEDNNHERGDIDRYSLYVYDVGTPLSLTVWHDNGGSGPGWFLDKVVVTKSGKDYWYYFDRWLDTDSGRSANRASANCNALPTAPSGGSWVTEGTPYIVHQTAVMECSSSHVRSTAYDSQAKITCQSYGSYGSWSSTTAICCPVIQHCESGYQSCSSNDNTCTRCVDNKVFFKPWDNDRVCKAMCSYDSHYCWPGFCTNELTDGCACAADFSRVATVSETSCQPTKKPTIETCHTVIDGYNGEKKRALSSTLLTQCQYLMDFYGNFQPVNASSEILTEFFIDVSSMTKPYFIYESHFGVTDARVKLNKRDITGGLLSTAINELKEDTASSTAVTRIFSTSTVTPVPSTGFVLSNGQRLCVQYETHGGGYLKSKDTAGNINSPVPYQKTSDSRELCYIYDTAPPEHCHQSGTCSTEPLYVSERVTRSPVFPVSFQDWLDPIPPGGLSSGASGIESYQVTVHEVETSSIPLRVYSSNMFSKKVNNSVTSMGLSLAIDRPKLICIALEVKDIADNVRQARRFVLVDNTSFIEIDDSKQLIVNSASAPTMYTWQTHHNPICISWIDYFYNQVYLDNPFLGEIEQAAHGLITGIYDQITGKLPVSGTTNVHGIVTFEVSWNLENGNIFDSLVVSNISSQTSCLNIALNDGETYTLTVKATDIADNTLSDNRTLHIDRSAPHINNISLIKDGYKMLFVHHTTDLSEMTLYFETLDPHSGIQTIHWKLATSDTRTELTTGATSVQSMEEYSCPQDKAYCYCPDVGKCEVYSYALPMSMSKLVELDKHEGNHNRNYVFTVTVTNYAMLSTIEQLDILVDDSPPEKGVVLEGPVGGGEIDYISGDSLTVHWNGFIDHESGIKLYRVALARTCLDETAFVNSTVSADLYELKEVPSTMKALTVPANFTGRMFTTVVALNNAMDMSEPVCSDGVTRTISPPLVKNVTLMNAQWSESLACVNGSVWLLDTTLTKQLLNITTACSSVCTDSQPANNMVNILPNKSEAKLDDNTSNDLCASSHLLTERHIIYLPHHSVNMSWDAIVADSQVADCFVGIGISSSESLAPSLRSYQSTNKHTHYIKHNIGIGSDQTFYIFIKVINKAGLESISTIGPVLIDETPPLYRNKPTVKIEGEIIVVGWENNTFYDLEQTEPIHKIQLHFDHNGTVVSPVLEWVDQVSQTCQNYSGGCITFPVVDLQTYDTDFGFDFVTKLRVYNRAGHFSTVYSEPFAIPSKYPPGHGIVSDIDPENTDSIFTDIDIHSTNNTVCATWRGFKHHENLNLEIAVGTLPGSPNIIQYEPVGEANYFCKTSQSLVPNVKYFVSIRASCSAGMTVSSSNGVRIIPEDYLISLLTVSVGNDCLDSDPYRVLHVNTNQTSSFTTLEKNFRFSIGYRYALVPFNNEVVISINGLDGTIDELYNAGKGKYYEVFPYTDQPEITISCNLSCNLSGVIEVYKCKSQTSISLNSNIPVHWEFTGLALPELTYKLTVFTIENNNTFSGITLFTKGVRTGIMQFRETISSSNTLPGRMHRIDIQPCISDICMKAAATDVFKIESFRPHGQIEISEITNDQRSCVNFHVKWRHFESDSPVILHQWAVVSDPNTMHTLTPWQAEHDIDGEFEIEACKMLPVHSRKAMFVCVRAFSEAGTMGRSCKRLDLQHLEEYTSNMVYDFDMSTSVWEDVAKVLHSKASGHLSKLLHDAELDFGSKTSRVVGAVVYSNGRTIRWFLMRHQHIPETCDSDSDCDFYEDNNESLIQIAPNSIKRNTIYYICAYSPRTEQEREYFTESLEEISQCSNGFVIDDVPPTVGTVKVTNFGGYLTDLSAVFVEWEGFNDNIDATQLGYVHSINYFSYAIGRRQGGEDLQNFTDVGLDTGVLLDNLHVRNGASIYVTVKATDHVGLSASAVSDELFIDTAPPTSGIVMIQCGHVAKPICNSYSIPLHLSAFEDTETGIDVFEINIGSSCDLSNIMSKEVFSHFVEIDLESREIVEGHVYCINVKARNRAGLRSDGISKQFIIDTSPPTGGHVIDGRTQVDVDYQTNIAHIAAHWRGFEDVQSGLDYYKVGLGLSPYTDDIEAMAYVGLATEVNWNSTFTPGIWYFTTVEACNHAGVCRSLASDGVLLDNSPPTFGVVNVGSAGEHSKYIPDGSSLHIRWDGFEDPQSGIYRFEACVGTATGTCDVIPFFPCLLQSNIIRTGLNLSSNHNYYATVRSYNKVGLYVTQSSDSFRIDSSPPELVLDPRFKTEYTRISDFSSQWDRSLLTIEWKFNDNDSPITHNIVTLKTHHEGHTPIETLDVGPVNDVTLQMDKDKWLSDGDRYIAVITSCNAAGHCSWAESSDLLIDSTPSHLGGFKPPMTWHNFNTSSAEVLAKVNLTWYGFHDEESRIETFFVTVSRSYSGDELTRGIQAIKAYGTSGVGFTEQATTLTLREHLTADDVLILSIWARNEAGLNSSVARVSVNVLSTSQNNNETWDLSGFLEIEKHSCDIHFCNKDCTCAVVGKPCSDVVTNDTCVVLESDDLESKSLPDINVFTGLKDQPVSQTASSTCISAYWERTDTSENATLERFEWSIGLLNQPVGEGIFDLKKQRPWNDVGQQTEIVYCLMEGNLIHNEYYVAYVRVWYSKITSRIYTSEPILIDQTPPAIKRGASVKDSDLSCKLDFAFIHWTTNITACWQDVFRETQSQIAHYTVALGTSPMADDVFPTTNIASVKNKTISRLHLHPRTKYFVTVTAYNTVGLHTSLSSDGFLVDTDIPTSGVVFNTASHKDTLYQHSTNEFSISWHGFQDNFSGIKYYSVALINNNNSESNDPTFINVGLQTIYTFRNLTLTHGDAYVGLVKATDAAGHVSSLSKSDPKRIDTTPPVGLACANFSVLHVTTVQMTHQSNDICEFEYTRGSIILIYGTVTSFEHAISLLIDRKAVMLPLYRHHGGTFLFEYSFISHSDRNTTLKLEIDHPSNETVIVEIDSCVSKVTEASSGLQVQQIMPAMFTVQMMMWDQESSIYKVQLGVGSTPGGFQVRGLSPIHTINAQTLHVSEPHGTALYFTTIAENYAGLRSVFTSQPITVDKTSPVFIQAPSLQINFGNSTDDNAVTVSWKVEELESGTDLCYCALGHPHNPVYFQPFTEADDLDTCTFYNVSVAHGDVLVATVRCVNHVQLVSENTSNILVISLEPPINDSARLDFITTDERAIRNHQLTSNQDSGIYFQSNNTCLQFGWTGFEDMSGIEYFEYRLHHGGLSLNSWTGTSRKTMALFNDKSLTPGSVYTAEVRAVNVGGLASEVTNSDVIIDTGPKLTGSPVKVRQTGSIMSLDWDNAFVKTHELTCLYDVTVGTRAGYSDVFDRSALAQTNADVMVGSTMLTPNAKTMHISVTCAYVTGESITYITSYNLK